MQLPKNYKVDVSCAHIESSFNVLSFFLNFKKTRFLVMLSNALVHPSNYLNWTKKCFGLSRFGSSLQHSADHIMFSLLFNVSHDGFLFLLQSAVPRNFSSMRIRD